MGLRLCEWPTYDQISFHVDISLYGQRCRKAEGKGLLSIRFWIAFGYKESFERNHGSRNIVHTWRQLHWSLNCDTDFTQHWLPNRDTNFIHYWSPNRDANFTQLWSSNRVTNFTQRFLPNRVSKFTQRWLKNRVTNFTHYCSPNRRTNFTQLLVTQPWR